MIGAWVWCVPRKETPLLKPIISLSFLIPWFFQVPLIQLPRSKCFLKEAVLLSQDWSLIARSKSDSNSSISFLVLSRIFLKHAKQKGFCLVNPASDFGIWKYFCPFRIVVLQREQRFWLFALSMDGFPVDRESREGVLPFGFGTENTLVLSC